MSVSIRPNYAAPKSIEQIIRIPQEVFDVPHGYCNPPYGSRIQRKLPLTNEAEQIVWLSYTEEKQLTPANGSQTTYLYPFVVKREDILTTPDAASLGNSIPADIQLPVSSSEAEWIIASLKSAFGLTTKDISDVLHVERQTIYAWIRNENQPKEDNGKRLRLLEKYANRWNHLSSASAKEALHIKCNEATLFRVLCQKRISEAEIEDQMKHAVNYIKKLNEKKRPTRSNKPNPPVSEYDVISLDAFIPEGLRRQD